ncbi:MAG: hypothetical protein GX635_10000 [Synergistaceae bacterium]|jgi:hypothetical protein|nr:hypothetical protein [Synergistaceae bacterium]
MKRIGFVVFLTLLFLMGWFAVRDVSLELDHLTVEKANLPDMSLEKVEFQREVEGVEWTATIERAERRGKEIRLLSLDIAGIGSEKQRWSLQAPTGLFLEERGKAVLSDVRGSVATGESVAYFEAPEAEWSEGATEVLFVDGASFRRSDFYFEGNSVRVSFSGVFSAEKGASFTWIMPENTE